MSGDPYWGNVTLALHCDGVNNGTTITDVSGSALNPPTARQANTYIKTSPKKFGTASLYTYGGYLRYASNAAFGFGANAPFTASLWFYPLSLYSGNCPIFDWCYSGGGAKGGLLYISSSGLLKFRPGTSGTTIDGATTLEVGSWYHVELSYDGTTIRCFLNGALHFSGAASLDFESTAPLVIGSNYALSEWFYGYFDDILVTKGVCRHTAGFSVPTEAFSETDDTLRGTVSTSSMLGQPELLSLLALGGFSDAGPLGNPQLVGTLASSAWASAASVLDQPAMLALCDVHAQIAGSPVYSTMDLTLSDDSVVRVPIASWSATLELDGQCYLRCTIPAPGEYIDALVDAVSFGITLRTQSRADAYPVTRRFVCPGPLSVQTDQGAVNYSAQISGYFDAYSAKEFAHTWQALGLQSLSVLANSARVRCSVNWLMEPGDTLTAHGVSMTVAWMNLYASEGLLYMDAGSRGL